MAFIRKHALFILILFHLVGLVGIVFINRETFAGLTPYNLLLSALLMLAVHHPPGRRFWLLFGFCFVSGWLVELLGTKTGLPFGNYWYGPALGYRLSGVPVIIGINWFLMVMGSGFIARYLLNNRGLQILLAAAVMTLIDLAIEPLAPALDYWYWQQGQAPALNYLGWLLVSVAMQLVFQFTVAHERNPIAIPYILTVTGFFLILNFTL